MKKILVGALAALAAGCGTELPFPFDSDAPASGQCEEPGSVLANWVEEPQRAFLEPNDGGPQRFVVRFSDAQASAPQGISPMMAPKPERALSEAEVAIVERAGGEVALRLPQQRAVAAVLSADEVEALRADARVASVEVDPRRYALSQKTPWGIPAIGAPAAWSVSNAALPPVKTCVIDSGLYATHDDFVFGTVTGVPEDWAQDSCGHGTHVAGTIAAYDNDRGVVGVNPRGTDLHIVRVFGDDCGWTYASELSHAVEQCQAAGAKVVNMSLGGFGASSVEAAAFERAWRNGLLMIAAAGNDGSTDLQYPASYPTVVSVGAIEASGELAPFSQRNARVDLVAPGAEIASTVPFVSRHSVTVGERTFDGGPIHNTAQTTGIDAQLVDGGLCQDPGAWSGKTVLCRRGTITFAEKVSAVIRGGGVAALIYNHEAGSFAGTLGEVRGAIPAIALSGVDGDALKAHVGQQVRVVSEARREGSGYAAFSGTSMAAPHVAGVAALIWGQEPNRTNAEVGEALEATAQDLGVKGRDNSFGHGLVRADLALSYLREHAAAIGAPRASFLAHCEGLSCRFRDVSLDPNGTIAGRLFELADGTTSERAVFEHTFTRPGPHNVRLTATDDAGLQATFAVPVSAVVLKARGGPLKSDGSREVALDWAGAGGESVLVFRNGELLGAAENKGGGVDKVKDGKGALRYRVCDGGATSCSIEVEVLPVCG